MALFYKNNINITGVDDPYVSSSNITPTMEVTGFIYPGYIIDNWNTKTDGSGTKYTIGEAVEDGSYYAIWKKPPKYLVTAEQLEKVADAIRENCTRTDTKLSYPWGFIEGIEDDGKQYLNDFLNGQISYVKYDVSYLSDYVFYSNSNIISVNFPICTTIGNSAFNHCSNLISISFPICTSIGNYAFGYCHKLLSAYFLGFSIPSLTYSNAFTSTPIADFTSYTSGEYGSIFVRASMLEEFKSATNWTYFSDRMVGLTDEEIADL